MQADIRLVDLIGALASYRRKGKSSSVGASVGAVAGLVCITPGAGFVTPGWSIAIGALGAVWCYLSVEVVNKAREVADWRTAAIVWWAQGMLRRSKTLGFDLCMTQIQTVPY